MVGPVLADKRERSAGSSRSKTVARDADRFANSTASVVFPTCRAPRSTTAGNVRKRSLSPASVLVRLIMEESTLKSLYCQPNIQGSHCALEKSPKPIAKSCVRSGTRRNTHQQQVIRQKVKRVGQDCTITGQHFCLFSFDFCSRIRALGSVLIGLSAHRLIGSSAH